MNTKVYQLSDLVSIKYGKNQKKVEDKNGEFPIYGTGGLMGRASTFLYDKPSVLIGRKGTIDKVRYVDHPFWTVDTLFYTIVNEELVIPKYLFYLMSIIDLGQYNEGTTIPSLRTETLNRIELGIPSLEEQQKVLDCLNPIDAKIEINNQINRNLSEQADTIYRERFVMNPDPSWINGHLSDLITVKYGKDHKKLEDGDIPCYGSGGVMRYVERSLYDKESVLIPRKGTLNNVMYVNMPFWSVDTMFFTVMNVKNAAKFVYHFVKDKDLAAMNAGSAVPSMTTDILNAMELLIPSTEALAGFEDIVRPLYKAILNNEIENKKLAELRDGLLAKLMSGELDVSELEI